MKVVIRPDPHFIYGHKVRGEYVPPKFSDRMEVLRKIAGKTLVVETKHLFDNQFNTGPIEGVSTSGIRVMLGAVADIIDDYRIGRKKCGWCWKHYPVGYDLPCPCGDPDERGMQPWGPQKYRMFLAVRESGEGPSIWHEKKKAIIAPPAT